MGSAGADSRRRNRTDSAGVRGAVPRAAVSVLEGRAAGAHHQRSACRGRRHSRGQQARAGAARALRAPAAAQRRRDRGRHRGSTGVTTSLHAIGVGPVALAVLILHVAMASPALAQSIAAVRPLFGMTHAYDSNLFASPDRPEGYFVMRMTPGVEAERRSPVMALLGRYTVDLEHLAQPSTMTAAASGQAAVVQARYQASRRTSASIDAAFTRTRTPAQLSPVPGLTLGRVTAERLEVHPTVVRNLDGQMSSTVEYTFTRDRAGLVGDILSHRAGVGLDRQISRRDFVGLTYDV